MTTTRAVPLVPTVAMVATDVLAAERTTPPSVRKVTHEPSLWAFDPHE
jgi:hypothetical protein